MKNNVLTFLKQKKNDILLVFGLVCLCCTVFCLFGYCFRIYWTNGIDQKTAVLYNFFSLIFGGICWYGVTTFEKLDGDYTRSVATPAGITLFILQMLIILITVLIILNLVIKKVHSKKIILGMIGLVVVFAIASTVLALAPVLYGEIYRKEEIWTLSDILSQMGEDGVVTIQLTQAQIAYVVLASIGAVSVITSVALSSIKCKRKITAISNKK